MDAAKRDLKSDLESVAAVPAPRNRNSAHGRQGDMEAARRDFEKAAGMKSNGRTNISALLALANQRFRQARRARARGPPARRRGRARSAACRARARAAHALCSHRGGSAGAPGSRWRPARPAAAGHAQRARAGEAACSMQRAHGKRGPAWVARRAAPWLGRAGGGRAGR